MRKQQTYQFDTLSIGTCYYPEQWDESLWEQDLHRMEEAGITTIRIAEFSWSIVEPREGQFVYDFFDRFLSLVETTSLKVIFGTPTATPPAWLTEKYPEVLNCRQDGVPYRHGMRRHYNYSSPIYRQLCSRIVEAFASHYAKHPSVIGWQIDNEINCETSDFYSESDSLSFRSFLQNKYKTLDHLNAAWGTVFWNQTYTDWNEIYVPRTTIHNSTNPHHVLDYIRFVSHNAISFCKMQEQILRRYIKPGDFITTNGMFSHLDNHKLADQVLDIYTYDSYPNFAFGLRENPKHSSNLNDRRWSNHLTEVRSICPHFGIMEQQSGAMGWNTRMEAPAPKPGQMLLWAMQSVAHGADYINFFRWRTSIMGSEIYWHGILDYDNRDNRKLAELKEFHNQIQKIPEVTGSAYNAAFALLRDYDNVWDCDVDRWHQRLTYSSEEEIFIASQLTHTPMDYLYLLDDTSIEELLHYPVIFYPHPLILTQKRAALLQEYCNKGGILIIGARTGLKDLSGKCVMMPMPGLLSSLSHTTVDDYTFVGPADNEVTMNWNEKEFSTGIFNDVLAPSDDAKILATYSSNYYKGAPALVERTVGDGKILHFGGTFTRDTVAEFFQTQGILSPWKSVLSLSKDCELCVRQTEDKTYFFVLNYMAASQTIELHKELTNALSKEKVIGQVTLKPYEVFILHN